MDTQTRFDKKAENYLARSQRGLWRVVRQKEWAGVRRLVEGAAPDRVLDVGCGAGFYSLKFAEEFEAEIHGIDISKPMTDQYRSHGFRVFTGSFFDYVPTQKYDLVLALGVLEFVADFEQAMQKFSSFLHDNGRLILLKPAENLMGDLYRLYHRASGTRTHAADWESLVDAGRECGLRVERFYSTPPLSEVGSFQKKTSQ